jgi:hypothetical protein
VFWAVAQTSGSSVTQDFRAALLCSTRMAGSPDPLDVVRLVFFGNKALKETVQDMNDGDLHVNNKICMQSH